MAEERRYRTCPHCGKDISARATRCKYCFEPVTAFPSVVRAPQPLPSDPSGAVRAQPAIEPMGVPSPGVAPSVPPIQRYRYHVVPFIGTIKTGFFSNDNAQTVGDQLQHLISDHARKGWQFYSLEKVNIQVNPGCIGQLFGQRESYITFDQVIFRQAV